MMLPLRLCSKFITSFQFLYPEGTFLLWLTCIACLICSCHSPRRKEAADPCHEKSCIACARSLCCRCGLCTFGVVQRRAKAWESASGQGVPCKLRKNCWNSGASDWLHRRYASSEVSVTTAVLYGLQQMGAFCQRRFYTIISFTRGYKNWVTRGTC